MLLITSSLMLTTTLLSTPFYVINFTLHHMLDFPIRIGC